MSQTSSDRPMFFKLIGFLFALLTLVVGDSPSIDPNPVVQLDYGSVQGQVGPFSTNYLGVPYATPPTGNLRFAPPQPPLQINGTFNASAFGAPCSQQALGNIPGAPLTFPASAKAASEDCLFINVMRPSNPSLTNLPVVFYIYGGGFEVGDSGTLPGYFVVNRSVTLDAPVIFVSANYRLNAFGFLGGKEVKDRNFTNVGLLDQRLAMQWIQQNIAKFGGDPNRLTIWGESAGATSVGLHMTLNGGENNGLFSAAVMQSGSPKRLPHVLDQQKYFDSLVESTNCTGAPDRFVCLQQASFVDLQAAVNATPAVFFSFQSLNSAWSPMVDDYLIPDNPIKLVEAQKFAKVPFINGDCQDEGTLFAAVASNITTNETFIGYIKNNYFPYITDDQMQQLAAAYPDDIQGSPYNTGTDNILFPQFKRIASLVGDMVFQAPRRALFQAASKSNLSTSIYSYQYMKGSDLQYYGAFHGSDIVDFFAFQSLNQTVISDYYTTDALIYFVNKYDPNPPAGSISLLRNVPWAPYSASQDHPSLTIGDLLAATTDSFRSAPIDLMIQLLKL